MLVEVLHKVTQVIQWLGCSLDNRRAEVSKDSQAKGKQLDIGRARPATRFKGDKYKLHRVVYFTQCTGKYLLTSPDLYMQTFP